MNSACSAALITMLGSFLGFCGSFCGVTALIWMPCARIVSTYFTKYRAYAG